MAIPTFNNIALCTGAGRDRPGSPEARYHTDTMPGLDGRFVQPFGTGARKIHVDGVLQATGNPPAEAHQNLKAALRTKQDLADGQTVAAYVGTDGNSYSNCMLAAYDAAGAVAISPAGPPHTASVPINATILELTP